MNTAMALLYLRAAWIYGTTYASVAMTQALLLLDAVLSFSIAFAAVYGTVTLVRTALPAAPGGRPRVWAVPLVFAGVAAAFPLFSDRFVSAVAGSVRELCGIRLDTWILYCAAGAWLAGVLILLLRAGRGVRALSRHMRRLPAIPPDSAALRALAAAGPGRAVTLREGEADSPVVSFGIARPCIRVPANFAARFTEDERYAVLLHECAHIRNHDTAKLFFLALVKALFWYDPCVKHALGHVKTGLELLCDQALVGKYGVDRFAYAELVVKAASGKNGEGAVPEFSGAYRAITARLEHILPGGGAFVPSRLSCRGAAALLAGLVILLAASAVLYAGLPPPAPANPDQYRAMNITVWERHGVLGTYSFAFTTGASSPEL